MLMFVIGKKIYVFVMDGKCVYYLYKLIYVVIVICIYI